ncbi:MAG: ankyrin repeat domain-containing protein [Actinomycetota bacterium]
MKPRRAWETEFHFAARTGDLQTVLTALHDGLTPDQRDQRGNTALILAAKHGHLDVASVLLEHGAEVDARVKWRVTPLFFAVTWGHPEIALLLIEHGADVNHVVAIEERSVCSLAAIHRHRTVLAVMLQRGADPNHRDARGRTALSYAREAEDQETAQLLEQAGGTE